MESQGCGSPGTGLGRESRESNCSHSQQFCFERTCLRPNSAGTSGRGNGRGQGGAEVVLNELEWRAVGAGTASGEGVAFSGSVRPPAASSPVSVCVSLCVCECMCVCVFDTRSFSLVLF